MPATELSNTEVHKSKPPSSLKGNIRTELWHIPTLVHGKEIGAVAYTYICKQQEN